MRIIAWLVAALKTSSLAINKVNHREVMNGRPADAGGRRRLLWSFAACGPEGALMAFKLSSNTWFELSILSRDTMKCELRTYAP